MSRHLIIEQQVAKHSAYVVLHSCALIDRVRLLSSELRDHTLLVFLDRCHH